MTQRIIPIDDLEFEKISIDVIEEEWELIDNENKTPEEKWEEWKEIIGKLYKQNALTSRQKREFISKKWDFK